MIAFARVAAAIAVVGAVADAASFPRATKKCTTIDSGYLNIYIGSRIVIVGDNASDGSPKCFTITNPSASTGPWYAKAEPCTSDTNPSLAQTFGYGNDFGNVILWTNKCGAGIAVDANNHPQLTSDHRVKFDCKTSWESMALLNTTYSNPS